MDDYKKYLRETVDFLNSLELKVGTFEISFPTLAYGLLLLILLFWAAGALSRWFEVYLRGRTKLNYNTRELIAKFSTILIYFIALLIALSAIGVDITAFAVFGGALGVGLGLGLQKITANFVSGVTLLMEKSIQIGDLVEVGPISGIVRQLNIRYALIETPDGREIMMPNDELAATSVTNWTHTNRRARVEVNVGVAYGSDPALVKKLLLEAAAEHPRCLKEPEPNCWLREFADSSLNFLLIFWIADITEGRFGPKSDVMFSILEKFKANGIDIPFPHRIVQMKAAG